MKLLPFQKSLGSLFGPAKLRKNPRTKKSPWEFAISGNALRVMRAMIECSRAGDIIQAIFEMPSPALHIPELASSQGLFRFGNT
jgi:hypothetical protein